MGLPAGTRIGHYEIAGLLGAGGMGEVYRARDSKLGRDVALKVLPQIFASNPDRMARFDREARLLASLNHHGIAQIHGMEAGALVMEMVEGQTLAERIQQGPMPLEDALPIATAIADALEYAHEKGIVHRDLKPANVKITPEGAVKLLDFGLAKALEDAPAVSGADNSPTVSMQATQQGVILGTAGYMSPEQARGKNADRRADIWSFGVVLYEMLTARKVFQGEDVTETLASVVKEQPDLTAAPREVRRLLEACLQKDPRKRLQSIGDWKFLMQESPRSVPEKNRAYGAWIAAAVLLAVLVSLGLVHYSETPPELAVRYFPLGSPAGAGRLLDAEISPDGRSLAFMLGDISVGQIYLRRLDSDQLTPLKGTEGVSRQLFWSADSRFIAFFDSRARSLKVIPAAGGPVEVLCRDVSLSFGGTWNRDGVILFGADNELRRVDIMARSSCTAIGKGAFPVFLPDGHHFFYQTNEGVFIATLNDLSGRKVLADRSRVIYTAAESVGRAAHILFLRDTTLMAQPFDESNLEPVGDPFAIVDGLLTSAIGVKASAVADGTLVYLAGAPAEAQLTWFDRTNGKELGTLSPKGRLHRGVTISPDGNFATASGWLYDLTRPGTDSPMEGSVRSWSSDSRRLLVSEFPRLYWKDLKSEQKQLVEIHEDIATFPMYVSDLSSDGRYLILTRVHPETGNDIVYVELKSGKAEPAVTFLGTVASETLGRLRPDGKWLAYISTVSGQPEVWIRSFPTGEIAERVSTNGALDPRWSPDGNELFFVSAPQNPETAGPGVRSMMVVRVESKGDKGLQFGPPRRVFDARFLFTPPLFNNFSYAPHPDGKRLLVNIEADRGEPTLHVIQNWHRFVERRRP